MRSERVDAAAMLRGEGDDANGTDAEVRRGELLRIRGYYSPEFLRRIAEREVVAPPWRLLVDPTAWSDVDPGEVEGLLVSFLAESYRWPNLDDVRRRFGRVSNHRAPGEAEGQEALL